MSVVAPPIAAPDVVIPGSSLLTKVHEVGRHRRPQRLGVMYVVAGLAFFPDRGARAGVIRWQPRHGRQHRRLAAGLQPALHRARDHDDLPGGHPDRVRLCQLPWCHS